MKKFLAMIAAACLLCVGAFALTACGGNEKADLGNVDFVVGFDAGYPPFGYMADDGSYTGFDLELAQEVCNRNGWTYSATPIDWDAKDAQLESGAILCIWNGFTYEQREDQYTWSKPYYRNAQVIVVKKDSDIKGVADLEGKVVMTQKGSAAAALLAEDGDCADTAKTFKSLEQIGDYNSAFMNLDSGAVDAVICDLSIAAYQTATSDQYVMLEEALNSESYAVGFLLDGENSQALADTVTATLLDMYKDGTIEKLCQKYADQGVDMANWILTE